MSYAVAKRFPLKFFGPVDSNSPRKRRKIDGPELIDLDEDPDECVESMPGFHEHDERDLDPSQHDEEEDELQVTNTKIDVPKLKPRPPVSAPARSFPSAGAPQGELSDRETRASTATHGAKPASTIGAASKRNLTTEPLRCPVCDKTISTDNEGLNAHIDFCLSRSAIREAQAESIASSSTKRLKPSQR